MRVEIQDRDALLAVSPAALSAYARSAGWTKAESYGDFSDVYVNEDLPEIVVPRTDRLGDYASVVRQLLQIFAAAADLDQLSLYRDLAVADRDTIRLRVEDDATDGTLSLERGLSLVRDTQRLVLAAACSLSNPQPVYRLGANKEASRFLERVRLGQTEQGSYGVTLLTPVVPPPLQMSLSPDLTTDDEPIERGVTRRLASALTATRQATESIVSGDQDAFSRAVPSGVSANFCEALVGLTESFPSLEASVVWARTRPMPRARDTFRFAVSDAPILREAARVFRDRSPRPDVVLFGVVPQLKREEDETEGAITVRTSIDGKTQSVVAVLEPEDYDRAIQAHQAREPVFLKGDLERQGQRWRLRYPRIVAGNQDGAPEEEAES